MMCNEYFTTSTAHKLFSLMGLFSHHRPSDMYSPENFFFNPAKNNSYAFTHVYRHKTTKYWELIMGPGSMSFFRPFQNTNDT